MQREFSPIVKDLEERLHGYFAERIVSAYLHGSVNRGDAIPGLSDLDYFIILSGTLCVMDQVWLKETAVCLKRQYPIVDEIHLMPKGIHELAEDPFTRFILEQNADLRFGKPVSEIQELASCMWYRADKSIAKMRLSFADACFCDALKGLTPASTGEVPQNTYYAARKYARYFVVIEGAYFLMTRNAYQGFEIEQVLGGLRREAPQFAHEIELSEKILFDPIAAGIRHDLFLLRIKPLVERMFSEIKEA